MPHVELLPSNSTTSTIAPGWTYVVDTGYDPSKVAINPRNKKRVAAQHPGGRRGEPELSARQQTAIARRIAELERDNDVKQSIGVPGKGGTPKTQNARRILQYQRQIKHWLDDEEAQIAQQQQQQQHPSQSHPQTVGAGAGGTTSRPTAHFPPRRTTALLPPPPSATAAAASSSSSNADIDAQEAALLSPSSSLPAPLPPSSLAALLSAPPLSYSASRVAGPPAGSGPQRQFCDNCGYWGQIRCLKCGARVCGVACREAHEGTRCLKWA